MANRLSRESSPYLLLHADNPVDWHPWGEEAFALARREDKPIFLSVGYSTCYWCHVMARESFSDPVIAHELNEGFVCIKVDREERPDVDELYMIATQLIARQGGWPNSVFLTPDLEPFFAGTYFPPRDLSGRPGFPRVLQSLRQTWLFRRAELLQQAKMVAQAMEEAMGGLRGSAVSLPSSGLPGELRQALAARFDPEWGGFGQAPKFPSPANLFFLLDRPTDQEAVGMLVATLDRMARGGLMDQLAGGFHRYSTDDEWLVPHFEKMLYDNACLAWLYAEASVLAPEHGFDRVARATVEFVLAEMTGPHGGFLSAISAETGGEEGAYYTWSAEELDVALGTAEAAELFLSVHGVEGPPPFEGERYVLHQPRPLRDVAQELGTDEAGLLLRLEPGREALLEARARRERPLTDDKVLADWNGLMIAALARCAVRLGERRYLAAAERAARFVLDNLKAGDGTLLHSWRGAPSRVSAFLDDYAFVVAGLLELHAATGASLWADEAIRLAEEQEARLGDVGSGGCFSAGADPALLVRAKPSFDGPALSGNGVSALNAIELARHTAEGHWLGRAERTLQAFAGPMEQSPAAHVTLVRALERFLAATAASAAAVAPTAEPQGVGGGGGLEDEAYDVVEAEGRLGRGDDEEWSPFRLELSIRRGFHLNAHPAAPGLEPTAVCGVLGRVRNVRYPAASGGTGSPPVYTGQLAIEGEIERRGGGAPAVELRYQACDDARCLPAVTRIVRLK